MKLDKFIGINNVAAPERLKSGELTAALNVDLDSTGALLTRRGRTVLRAECVHSLFQAPFGLIGVVETDLVLFNPDGTTAATIYFSLGLTRVWYETLADGRVVFSNELITGVTDGGAALPWGTAPPTDAGFAVTGETPYFLTHTRLSDGLESGPLFCGPTLVGGTHSGLPLRDGHSTNVYYAVNGMHGFLAGTTLTDVFTFTGTADQLVQPCQTEHLVQPGPWRCLARWRGRMLGAVGNVLFATQPLQFEHHDPRRDFIQLEGTITLIAGCEAGVWVGSTLGLWFLEGTSFTELALTKVREGAVVLGSGATADLDLLPEDARMGAGGGTFCISGGEIYLCAENGKSRAFAAGQYKSTLTEVVATTRVRNGVLQYVAASLA